MNVLNQSICPLGSGAHGVLGARGSDLEGGLPALINEVDGQGANDEDAQAGDKHVVDGTEMLYLHQLTEETGP